MLLPTRRRAPLAAAGAALVLTVGACGGSADPTSAPATGPTSTDEPSGSAPGSTTAPPSTDAAGTTIAATATTESPGTTTTQAPSTSAAPTTTVPSPTGALSVPIPSGVFRTHPTDIIVLRRDGTLEIRSDFYAGPPTLVADYPDPFGPFTEGPGPNVVDDVAGIVDGSVVFGDCCEPISGNVRVATDAGVVQTVAGGYSPALSTTHDLLGTANDYLISQTAADATGEGSFRQLNQDPEADYLHMGDLTWSTMATADPADDHMVLLGWTNSGWALYDVDRSTLQPTRATELGVPAVPEAPDVDVSFIGHGPGAEIAVAVSDGATTRLRYFAPTTLDERPLLERSLPGSATSIRLDGDGLGLLWVDGDALYHLRAGEFEAERIGLGVLAAWFV